MPFIKAGVEQFPSMEGEQLMPWRLEADALSRNLIVCGMMASFFKDSEVLNNVTLF